MRLRKPTYEERRAMSDKAVHLGGFSHQQLMRARGLKGSKIGPANRGRRLSPEERAAVEQQMREQGKL